MLKSARRAHQIGGQAPQDLFLLRFSDPVSSTPRRRPLKVFPALHGRWWKTLGPMDGVPVALRLVFRDRHAPAPIHSLAELAESDLSAVVIIDDVEDRLDLHVRQGRQDTDKSLLQLWPIERPITRHIDAIEDVLRRHLLVGDALGDVVNHRLAPGWVLVEGVMSGPGVGAEICLHFVVAEEHVLLLPFSLLLWVVLAIGILQVRSRLRIAFPLQRLLRELIGRGDLVGLLAGLPRRRCSRHLPYGKMSDETSPGQRPPGTRPGARSGAGAVGPRA
mmetsp:Transcript_118931/g.253716  ORF Transcript_118931/g.253716 Transcript_118931/m.253716 type:complete len:276 (+) Transcript_118931:343-1170(+)